MKGFLKILSIDDFGWPRQRATHLWPDWRDAADRLISQKPFVLGGKKKVDCFVLLVLFSCGRNEKKHGDCSYCSFFLLVSHACECCCCCVKGRVGERGGIRILVSVSLSLRYEGHRDTRKQGTGKQGRTKLLKEQ